MQIWIACELDVIANYSMQTLVQRYSKNDYEKKN